MSLAQGHAAEAGVAGVDIVGHGGERVELHAEQRQVGGDAPSGRLAVEPTLLGVPAGGRVEGEAVALDPVEAVQDLAAPLVEVVDGLESMVVGHHGVPVTLEAFLEHAGRRRRLVEQALGGHVDVPVQDLQLADEVQRVALGLAQRDAGTGGEHVGLQQGRDRVRVPLEHRLLVAGDSYQGVEDPRRVGMEVQHLADAAPVLEVKPPLALQSAQRPARRPAQQRRLVVGLLGRHARLGRGDQLLTPLGPHGRLADQFLGGVEHDALEKEERLALELIVEVDAQDRPVERREGAGERAEEPGRNAREKRRDLTGAGDFSAHRR